MKGMKNGTHSTVIDDEKEAVADKNSQTMNICNMLYVFFFLCFVRLAFKAQTSEFFCRFFVFVLGMKFNRIIQYYLGIIITIHHRTKSIWLFCWHSACKSKPNMKWFQFHFVENVNIEYNTSIEKHCWQWYVLFYPHPPSVCTWYWNKADADEFICI